MRQRLFFSIVVMGMVCGCALASGGTLPGAGTEANPYLIEDVNDFDAFANPANAATYWAAGVHTKLTTDIDLSGRTYQTAVIAPYIRNRLPFTGVFNGNTHTISYFNFTSQNNSDIGLFGDISDATITNLGVTNVNIIANDYVGALAANAFNSTMTDCYSSGQISLRWYGGGLVGYSYYTSIDNCHSTVSMTAENTAGGLVGYNQNGPMTNSYATGSVTTTEYGYAGGLAGESYGLIGNCYATGDVTVPIGHAGGLIGYNTELVTNCYATGSVFGQRRCGGLIGENFGTRISDCYSTGSVAATGYEVGGLIGNNNRGTIQNCYSSGDVTGNDKVGGLIGNNVGYYIYTAIIESAYSTGKVVGNTNVGGLCGYQEDDSASIANCFWDTETSVIGNAGDDNFGAIGRTTAEMITLLTFTGAGWDFSETDGDGPDWMMLREGEDYPRLAWQEVYLGDIAGLYGVDMVDFARLAGQWDEPVCNESNQWCQGADIDHADGVDMKDLAAVAEDWLK